MTNFLHIISLGQEFLAQPEMVASVTEPVQLAEATPAQHLEITPPVIATIGVLVIGAAVACKKVNSFYKTNRRPGESFKNFIWGTYAENHGFGANPKQPIPDDGNN